MFFMEQTLVELEEKIKSNIFGVVDSVIIANKEKILYEKYFDKQGKEFLRNTRSATKTITSILIGIAIDKGFIKGVDENIVHYLKSKKPNLNERRKLRSKIY